MATFFFFFFFEPGVKLDEKSIENGLEGQKFLVVCLFWGGCHHPNKVYFSVNTAVRTTLPTPNVKPSQILIRGLLTLYLMESSVEMATVKAVYVW